MKVVRIVGAGSRDGTHIDVTILGEDQQPYELTLTQETALQLLLGLQVGATRLKHEPVDLTLTKAFVLESCSPLDAMTMEGGLPGLVLRTVEGFHIRILMTPETRSGLRECIELSEGGTTHNR